MSAWSYLKGILELVTLLKSVWGAIKSGFAWLKEFFRNKKQEEIQDVFHKAEQELADANKIEDENERLKAKAAAVKKMEDALRGSTNS